MATILYRIGRWSFRRRRLVTRVWLGVLVAAVAAAVLAPEAKDQDLSMPGTQSQKAFDLLDARFPHGDAHGAEARMVFRAPDGQRMTAAANRAAVESALASLGAGAGAHTDTSTDTGTGTGGDSDAGAGGQLASATDPYDTGAVSADGAVAYSTISYTVDAVDLTGATKSALEHAADRARDAGLTVEIGGSALDSEESPGGTTELVGVAVAAVVLVLALGSLVAAGLSLLTAFLGVGIAFGLISALAVPLGLTSTVGILALMLGLAVGIDYALFITSRFRDERARGCDPEEAAGRAVGTAGSAVVFAGATVFIALVGLGVVGIPELTRIGLGGAGAVGLAVLVALTLVPALFGVFGRRVLPRRLRRAVRSADRSADRSAAGPGGASAFGPAAGPGAGRPGLATRWARFVLRRPVAVLLVAGLGLGAVAVPALNLELGLPGDESKSVDTTQRRAYDLLSEGFGPGFNGPLTVVVDASASASGSGHGSGGGSPQSGGSPHGDGSASGHGDVRAAADLAARTVRAVHGVASVGKPVLDDAKDTAVFTAVPTTAPNSEATKDLVHAIRHAASGIEADTGAGVLVTGTTAMNIDISDAMADALLPYLSVVIGLAVLLLAVVFRSVLVPVKLGPGPGQGGARLPAVGGRGLRRPRGRLPVGLGSGPAGRRADRSGHVADADPRHRHRVRARHGLRGVPAQPDAGGVRPRRVPGRGDRPGLPAQRTGGGRGGDHHDQRVHRVRRDGHADDPDDGRRTGLRGALRRVRGADGDRAGGPGVARPPGLVAAPYSRPHAAERRHRGRGAEQARPGCGHGCGRSRSAGAEPAMTDTRGGDPRPRGARRGLSRGAWRGAWHGAWRGAWRGLWRGTSRGASRGPSQRPPRGPWWREAAVTAAAFALCLLGGMLHSDGRGLSAPPLAAYGVAVASCAVLPVRHRAPLAAMAATTAVGVLVTPLGLLLSPLIVAPAVITAYSLTARTRRHAAGAVALTSVALLVASTPLFGALSWKDASRVAAVAAFPLLAGVLGHAAQTRRAYLAAVEDRARRAEETREREARRRVAEERVRIARELHDLVAHQITLANAQATVAAHLFDVRPEQTRQSLDELVRTTRDALDELRATVGLLRQPDEEAGTAAGPVPGPGSAARSVAGGLPAPASGSASGSASGPASVQGSAPSEPAPGLSRLPTLLESFRRAGLRAEVGEQGTPRPLPPGVDLTAYRIVQEALTNVTKHAGTRDARVCLAWDRGRVTITVADDGPGDRTDPGARTGPAAAAGPVTGTGRSARTDPGARTGPGSRTDPGAHTDPGARTGAGAFAEPGSVAARDRASGYGLIGMRERATAVGGRLTAGPRPEGGFLVTAELPFREHRDGEGESAEDGRGGDGARDARDASDGEDGVER